MKYKISNQGGFAAVYGLIVLLLATLSGTAILFMTQKDRASVTDYAGVRSSSLAAIAALKAFEGQCAIAPDTTFAILKKYIINHNYKWLLGPSSASAATEQKIQFWNSSSAPKYSARIIGYDSGNSFIVIEGIGYDGMGGKKKAVASYQLDGLVMVKAQPVQSFGLFLGGALGNCNVATNLTGDVYLSLGGGLAEQHFNQGGTITGNLKTGDGTNVFDVNTNLTVTGNAYIRAPLKCSAVLRVNNKSGFEKQITVLDQQMQLFGDAFFNSTYPSSWNKDINLNNHAVTYNSTSPSIPTSKFVNASPAPVAKSSINIPNELGMTAGNESAADTVIMPVFAAGVTLTVSGAITSSNVETWWSNQKTAGKLYVNKWLVLKLNGAVSMNGGGPFTKKVIWITDNNAITVNGNWYDCADTSNTLIYVNGSGSMTGMGVPANKKFRGYIYNLSGTGNTYQFGASTTFYGSIHHAKGNFDLNNGGGPLNLVFNSGSLGYTALQELIDLGIVVVPGASTAFPPGLNLVDLKIRPTMIGMQL
jgi:hypothetical protein